MIEKNQEKIYNLVMDMLSFSKEREPVVEETDLNGLVRDVLELFAGRARELGVKLEARLEPTLPPIQVDPEGIHRAMLNIVGNALDAWPLPVIHGGDARRSIGCPCAECSRRPPASILSSPRPIRAASG